MIQETYDLRKHILSSLGFRIFWAQIGQGTVIEGMVFEEERLKCIKVTNVLIAGSSLAAGVWLKLFCGSSGKTSIFSKSQGLSCTREKKETSLAAGTPEPCEKRRHSAACHQVPSWVKVLLMPSWSQGTETQQLRLSLWAAEMEVIPRRNPGLCITEALSSAICKKAH